VACPRDDRCTIEFNNLSCFHHPWLTKKNIVKSKLIIYTVEDSYIYDLNKLYFYDILIYIHIYIYNNND